MTVSNTFTQHTNKRENRSSYSALRLLLVCSILLFGIPAFAQDSAPAFVNGTSQVFNGCENITGAAASGTNINTALAITDLDSNQLETWSIAATPFHGILSGFPTSDTSNGGVVTPTGLTYTPDSGYIGTDSFVIQVTDGTLTALTTVVVNVNGLPTLSSTLTPAAICDGTTFYYSPTSATGGATFAWHFVPSAGITPLSSLSGVGNVLQVLGNTTFYAEPATFVYTVSANGCAGVPQNVVVSVKPTPRLSSPLYDTVCNGGDVNYEPASLTSGTSYTWTRASTPGISPDTSRGTGEIGEALVNTTPTPVTAVYNFALAANGCTSAENVNITVNPQTGTAITSITTAPSSSICAGSAYLNFGASIPPPSGVTYNWSVTNGSIYRVSTNEQYILVNFLTAGTAVVTLSYNDGTGNCAITQNSTVTVGASSGTSGSVLYSNTQFVYTDNTADSYQWGYDDRTTLDPTNITGATFQSYVNTAPDLADNYYWVITTKDGCSKKTYYNAPSAIKNISSNVTVKVYPNPAGSNINVTLDNAAGNTTTIAIVNMLGQIINTQNVTGHAAQLNVATLPSGCYMINCLQDGVKIATTSFIKN